MALGRGFAGFGAGLAGLAAGISGLAGGLAGGRRAIDGTERGEAVFAAQHRAALELERGSAAAGAAAAVGVAALDANRPAQPSPLGLSNYDALDDEEVWRDEDEDEEDYGYFPYPDVASEHGGKTASEDALMQRSDDGTEYGDKNTRDPPSMDVDDMEDCDGEKSPNLGFPSERRLG